MKPLLTLVLSLLLFSGAFAQNTPIEFLNAVPQPPTNLLCGVGIDEKQRFNEYFAHFDSLYQAKIDEYKAGGNDKFLEEHQDDAMVNSFMKAGYSREDAEKMKDPNLSEQEKMAIANRMMMSKYNMDMDEMKKVADSGTAYQKRWVKAQSTMMMADAQLDPEGNQKKQLEIKDDLELKQEMKWLQDKLRAGENKYLEKIREIDVEADSAMLVLRPKLDKLQKDLEEGNGNSDQIIDQIVSLRKKHCERFTPTYLETIEAYKGYIAEHMQEYFELEEMQVKSMERQMGMKNSDYKPGAGPMGMVGSYRYLVGNAFKYNLNAAWGAQFIGY